MKPAFVRACVALAAVLLIPGVAVAVPTLQLWSDSAVYDPATESWVTKANPFTLWVVGATTPSKVQQIFGVTLYVAVPDYGPSDYITIQGLPSAPPADPDPLLDIRLGAGGTLFNVHDFGTPFGLPPHGVYPAFVKPVYLPNLMVGAAGETVLDYSPGSSGVDTGDIQLYSVSYSGFDYIHFDLGGIAALEDLNEWGPRFAPFSHDLVAAPEPATLLLLAGGLAGLVGIRRRSRK